MFSCHVVRLSCAGNNQRDQKLKRMDLHMVSSTLLSHVEAFVFILMMILQCVDFRFASLAQQKHTTRGAEKEVHQYEKTVLGCPRKLVQG